jgi:hypothetical protein
MCDNQSKFICTKFLIHFNTQVHNVIWKKRNEVTVAWEQQHNISTCIKRVVLKTSTHDTQSKSKKKIKFPKLLNCHKHNQITPSPSLNVVADTTTSQATKEKLETAHKQSKTNILSKIKKNVVAKWSKLQTFRWKGSPLKKHIPAEMTIARTESSLTPAPEILGNM